MACVCGVAIERSGARRHLPPGLGPREVEQSRRHRRAMRTLDGRRRPPYVGTHPHDRFPPRRDALMSLLRFLGLDHAARVDGPQEADSVRHIVEALDRMEPAAARHLARFAYVLGRVARADLVISADEVRAMEGLVSERGHLPEAQAVVVVQIAKTQNLLLGE